MTRFDVCVVLICVLLAAAYTAAIVLLEEFLAAAYTAAIVLLEEGDQTAHLCEGDSVKADAVTLDFTQCEQTVYLCADGEPFMTVITEAHEAFRDAQINFGGIDLEVCSSD